MGTDYCGSEITPHDQNFAEIIDHSMLSGTRGALSSATSNAADCLGVTKTEKSKRLGLRTVTVKGEPEPIGSEDRFQTEFAAMNKCL
jgi:hypothetical protein